MSSRHNRIRVLLASALFAAVVFGPWWLPLPFALVLAARWRAWEVIVAGVFYDLLWLPAGASFTSFETTAFGTIIALALVFIFEPLRRQLLIG